MEAFPSDVEMVENKNGTANANGTNTIEDDDVICLDNLSSRPASKNTSAKSSSTKRAQAKVPENTATNGSAAAHQNGVDSKTSNSSRAASVTLEEE